MSSSFSFCPSNIQASQIRYRKRAHRHAEFIHHPVDMLGCSTFFNHDRGLSKISLEHPIADKAVADTRNDGQLPHPATKIQHAHQNSFVHTVCTHDLE